MCLAMPAQVVEISANGDAARVSLGGVMKEVSLALVEDVQVGDYVLLHVGFALNKLSEEEAKETLRLFAETGLNKDLA